MHTTKRNLECKLLYVLWKLTNQKSFDYWIMWQGRMGNIHTELAHGSGSSSLTQALTLHLKVTSVPFWKRNALKRNTRQAAKAFWENASSGSKMFAGRLEYLQLKCAKCDIKITCLLLEWGEEKWYINYTTIRGPYFVWHMIWLSKLVNIDAFFLSTKMII